MGLRGFWGADTGPLHTLHLVRELLSSVKDLSKIGIFGAWLWAANGEL